MSRLLEARIVDCLHELARVSPAEFFGHPTVRDIADALNMPHLFVAVAIDGLCYAGLCKRAEGPGEVKLQRNWRAANDRLLRPL